MTISKELMLAILSMDAYNQGYGKGIDHGKTQIGSAKFDDDKGDQEAKDAGFYAVSYKWGSETVISYRGTDFEPKTDLQIDGRYGWAIGLGNYTNNQAKLSADFLEAAQEGNGGDVILTGHSLGGGLAERIAA